MTRGDTPCARTHKSSTVIGPRTGHGASACLDRQAGQHEHRHQPELALAVPRPPRRSPGALRDWFAALVNELSVPTTIGRTSAIRQHVLDMPALVVADVPRLPPCHRDQDRRTGRCHSEPLRPRRSLTATSIRNWRQLNTRPHQSLTCAFTGSLPLCAVSRPTPPAPASSAKLRVPRREPKGQIRPGPGLDPWVRLNPKSRTRSRRLVVHR